MNNILVITCISEKQASKMGQVIHKDLGLDYDIFESSAISGQFCPNCATPRPVWLPDFCTSCKERIGERGWNGEAAKYPEEYKRGWEDGKKEQAERNYPLSIIDQRTFKFAKPPWEKGKI